MIVRDLILLVLGKKKKEMVTKGQFLYNKIHIPSAVVVVNWIMKIRIYKYLYGEMSHQRAVTRNKHVAPVITSNHTTFLFKKLVIY